MSAKPSSLMSASGGQSRRRSDRARQRRSAGLRVAKQLLLTLLISMLAVTFFLPLAWLLSSSLKTARQIFEFPPTWIPHPVMWSNYISALTKARFDLFFRNTLFLALTTSIFVVLSSALVAYGFSRVEWPGRDALFFVVLSTMMIPYQVTMIPLYIVFSKIHWVGTYLPLTVPYLTGSAFYIFLLRQFFRSIPQELTDAARIDGCPELGIMFRIILPLARPALAMVVLFRVMGAWGDFLEPLIYINRVNLYTLSLGLLMFRGMYDTQWELLMAASAAVTLPVIVIFFFTQRTFIEGITFTGLKGA